ncbi:hypothetical protein M407DRAFT_240979 [Tulasnella calospora MUT 4182]|uniref:Uncharacterized protein n=1 Tax=Tulasnella calospora MUT 4182 TaxID=1051891 RepID=A0A0C3MIS7_9AGAM|nr:hypothetical protein M407DRAFT_240979 [Tulasnella calospora MUT 4182]
MVVDGNQDLLASNMSFSSSMTPSPAPSTLTFAQPPPPDLVQPVKSGRAAGRRPSRDEGFYRSTPAPTLTPSASSSSLSHQASSLLEAPVNVNGRNRSNTTSQESFSSTQSNVSDKDQVSKAEKELLRLEKSLQSFRTLSSESMQNQYSTPRAPSRVTEASRDIATTTSADRSRVLPLAKPPPPSSSGAALSANPNLAPRRPRKPSVTSEPDEEYYRRMHMALPPLPSAPSPVSYASQPRKDSTTSSSSLQSQRIPAAPSPNFSTRPIPVELDNPPAVYGRQGFPVRVPSAEALASRQPNAWRSNAADLSARTSVLSPTLTELDFPMPPTTTVRPGAAGVVRPGQRKESLLAASTPARPRRDYI